MLDRCTAPAASGYVAAIALLSIASATGCSSPIDIASSSREVLTAPGVPFYPFRCGGSPAFDPLDDQTGARQHRDIVGNPSVAESALYYASDADRLFLRMRLDGDPSQGATELTSFGWGYFFDTVERASAESPEYERLAHANGTGGSDSISLFDNTTIDMEDLASDEAETTHQDYADVVDRWRVDVACDAVSDTCFGGDDDFFLTYALEWSDLERAGPAPDMLPGIVKGRLTLLWAGTTVSNSAIDRDLACHDNQSDADPPISALPQDRQHLTCGNSLLEGDEGCDDGDQTAGDACDDLCLIEDGNPCNADPAGATGDASCASGFCDISGASPGVCSQPLPCGNGALDPGEGCDDGGVGDGDGCNAACLVENDSPCNDDSAGAVGDASCASTICNAAGGAPGVCAPPGCGNDLLESGEGCDDGNDADGDGCTTGCLIEDGNPCNDDPAGDTGSDSCASGFCDTTFGATGVCMPEGDVDGDGVADSSDIDDDNDGILDSEEGSGTTDSDGDGVPDSRDLDSDDDGIPDVVEAGHDSADGDSDGVLDCAAGVGSNGLCDELETAPDSGNPDHDSDGQGPDRPVDSDDDDIADYRDLDSDNDASSDLVEGATGCTDGDNNGVCDGSDSDGDGIVDAIDGSGVFGDDGYSEPPNSDSDSRQDFRDTDSDGDTVPDIEETGNGDLDDDNDGRIDDATDADGDGIIDVIDDSDGDGTADIDDPNPGSHGGLSHDEIDLDGDGVPNYRDPDSNDDGILDGQSVSGGGCQAGSGAGGAGAAAVLLASLWLVLVGRRRYCQAALESLAG